MKPSGTTVQKTFAVACIVAVLGAQAWTIIPPGSRSRERHWPFLNYPMYSTANHRGDSVILQELRAVPCGRPDTTLPVRAAALHVELGRYWDMLDRLNRPGRSAAMLGTLSRLARVATPVDICALDIWRQVLVLDRRGIRLDDHPWVKFREWTIGPDSSRNSVDRSRQ